MSSYKSPECLCLICTPYWGPLLQMPDFYAWKYDALAPRGKTEFRHLVAQVLSIRAVQQRNELLVLVVREFSSWKRSTLKYQITVFTYFVGFFFPQLCSHSNSIHLLPTFLWVIFHHEPCFTSEANSCPPEITGLLFTISLPGNSTLAALPRFCPLWILSG
jgi:hypothetical protein